MAGPCQAECSYCQIECEIEWRARISLADAQRMILQHFRDKSDVWVDEYRIKRFAQYQRRVGTRTHYSRYRFSTIRDFLTLHGLSPFYSSFTAGCAGRAADCDQNIIAVTPFSELKTTNCAHSFYALARNSSLQANNLWPRIFVIKRSLEIVNVESAYQTNAIDRQRNIEKHPGASGEAEILTTLAESIDNVFMDYQRSEMDRSDNNLGMAYVRKLYRIIPFDEKSHDKPINQHDTGRLRLAIYSIFDEYQQIRYEVGVEYEFNSREKAIINEKSWHPVSSLMASCCISSKIACVSIDAARLEVILFAVSQIIDCLISPYLYYVEKPMIKIDVDWLEGITSPTMLCMLSYQIPHQWVNNEESFANYVLDHLSCLSAAILTQKIKYNYFLRRKLDGERLYATYDGGHLLCLSNGRRLDLRAFSCQDQKDNSESGDNPAKKDTVDEDYLHLFSVDFIYQLEMVGENHYYITEVVAARHSYSTVLNSLVHSFSPSKNFYRPTEEQIWPYGLIGAGLDEHSTSSMIDFWVTSGCSEIAHGFLTRDIVETLRLERKKRQPDFQGSDSSVDDESTTSHFSLEEACKTGIATCYKNTALPLAFDRGHSESEIEEESECDGSSLTPGDGKLQEEEGVCSKNVSVLDGRSNNDKTINSSEAHSRFFVPISARDSRYYLIMLAEALSSLKKKNRTAGVCESAVLRVNMPLGIDLLDKQEVIDYYRSYIIRILNVLFLCGELSRCIDYAHKHFSSEYANYVESTFKHKPCCLSTDITIHPAEGSETEIITIDGYLLYREYGGNASAGHGQRTKESSPCALPAVLVEKSDMTSILKLKPFQTVELLMRVNIPRPENENSEEAILPLSISFFSQLRLDTTPSVFFTCTFPTNYQVIENPHQYLRSIEPDFKSACWKRYDEEIIRVFVDPRIELVDGLIYEFLCYNEREFYLIEVRPDKVLPDDEGKINSILWARKSSEEFFVV